MGFSLEGLWAWPSVMNLPDEVSESTFSSVMEVGEKFGGIMGIV